MSVENFNKYFTGVTSLGAMETRDIEQISPVYEIQQMLALVADANAPKLEEETRPLMQSFGDCIFPVVRMEGMEVPVKGFKVKFSQGMPTVVGRESQPYYAKRTLIRDNGWVAGVFRLNANQRMENNNLKAINGGKDVLLAKALETVENGVSTYKYQMQPLQVLQAAITGTSFHDTIPAFANATDDPTVSFGPARGEDYTRYLKAIDKDYKNMNLFRAIKSTGGLTEEDVLEVTNLLRKANTYTGGKFRGLASYAVLSNLKASTNATRVVTKDYVNTVPDMYEVYGVDFLACNYLTDDFIIIFDPLPKLFIKGVDPAEFQRGIGLVYNSEMTTADGVEIASTDISDISKEKLLTSGQLYIFPTETYMMNRLSVAVLAVNTTFNDVTTSPNGLMKNGGDAENALNKFVAALRSEYDFDADRD